MRIQNMKKTTTTHERLRAKVKGNQSATKAGAGEIVPGVEIRDSILYSNEKGDKDVVMHLAVKPMGEDGKLTEEQHAELRTAMELQRKVTSAFGSNEDLQKIWEAVMAVQKNKSMDEKIASKIKQKIDSFDSALDAFQKTNKALKKTEKELQKKLEKKLQESKLRHVLQKWREVCGFKFAEPNSGVDAAASSLAKITVDGE